MLNDAATAFVQSAFYGGYFLIAIPASLVIKKASYKFAIMTGLIFFTLLDVLFSSLLLVLQLTVCSLSLFLRLPLA